jgi:hypothetical protein
MARDSVDGKVGVREARREFGLSWEAAYRLLDLAGVRREESDAND